MNKNFAGRMNRTGEPERQMETITRSNPSSIEPGRQVDGLGLMPSASQLPLGPTESTFKLSRSASDYLHATVLDEIVKRLGKTGVTVRIARAVRVLSGESFWKRSLIVGFRSWEEWGQQIGTDERDARKVMKEIVRLGIARHLHPRFGKNETAGGKKTDANFVHWYAVNLDFSKWPTSAESLQAALSKQIDFATSAEMMEQGELQGIAEACLASRGSEAPMKSTLRGSEAPAVRQEIAKFSQNAESRGLSPLSNHKLEKLKSTLKPSMEERQEALYVIQDKNLNDESAHNAAFRKILWPDEHDVGKWRNAILKDGRRNEVCETMAALLDRMKRGELEAVKSPGKYAHFFYTEIIGLNFVRHSNPAFRS